MRVQSAHSQERGMGTHILLLVNLGTGEDKGLQILHISLGSGIVQRLALVFSIHMLLTSQGLAAHVLSCRIRFSV